MRWRRIITITALLCAILIIVGVVVLKTYDFNRFKPMIVSAVSDAIGRQLVIGGDIEVEIGLSPGFSVRDIRLQNAPWGLRPDMLVVDELEIQFSLLSLISGAFHIEKIILQRADILLETNAAGIFNLEFESQSKPSTATVPNIRIDEVLFEKVHLTYRDARKDRMLDVGLDRLDIVAEDAESPVHIDIKGHFNQYPISITGRTDRPIAAIQSQESFRGTVKAEALNTVVELNVNVESLRALTGIQIDMQAMGLSTHAFFELSGMPDIPEWGSFRLNARAEGNLENIRIEQVDLKVGQRGWLQMMVRGTVNDLFAEPLLDLYISVSGEDVGEFISNLGRPSRLDGPYRLTGRWFNSGAERHTVEDLLVSIGQNDLTANAQIDFSGLKPAITAEIKSHMIDLQPPFQPIAASRASTHVNKNDRRPLSMSKNKDSLSELFSAADVRLKMETQTIVLPSLTLTDLRTTATLAGGRLDVNISGSRLPDLEKLTTLTDMPEMGPFQITGRLKPTDKQLTLTHLHLKAGRPDTAEIAASGAIADLLTGRGFDLDLQLRGNDAADLARFIVEPWPLKGQYALTGRMLTDDIDLIRFENIEGTLEDIPFQGSVRVDIADQVPTVLVTVNSSRFNLKPLVWPGVELPRAVQRYPNLGPLNAKIRIAVPQGPVGFPEVRIQAGTQNLVEFALSGSVTNIEQFSGARLHVLARGIDLANLENLTGQSLPVKGPYSIEFDFDAKAAGRYHIHRMNAAVGGNKVSAGITVDTTRPRALLTARLDAEKIDLKSVIKTKQRRSAGESYFSETILKERLILPQWPQPPAIIINNDAKISVDIKRIIGERFNINGFQGQVQASSGRIELTAEGNLRLEDHKIQDNTGRFEIGRTDLIIKATTNQDLIAIDTFRLQTGTPETITLFVEGHIRDAVLQQGLDLMIELQGNDAAYLNRFFDNEKPLSGPFQLSAHLTDPKRKHYRIDQFALSIADSDLTGMADIDLAAERPSIEAKLASRQLDVRPFLGDKKSLKENQPRAPKTDRRKLFSTDPLPLNWLDMIDIHMTYAGRQFTMPFAEVNDVNIVLDLADGNLTLKPVNFTSGQTTVDGHLIIQKKGHTPIAEIGLQIDNYDIGKELADLGRARDIEGLLNAKLNIAGPADSTAAFTGALNGNVTLNISNGRINNRYIGLVYSDLTSTFINMINPFGRRGRFVDLNCLVSTFNIQNGQAENASVLDTPDTTLFVVGDINLKTERLNVTLKSTPKRGVRVSGVGRIGVGISKFTRPFKLGGTLTEPTLVVDPTQTAFTFGKILGGLALGPAGIAWLLTDVSLDEQNPCLKEFLDAEAEAP